MIKRVCNPRNPGSKKSYLNGIKGLQTNCFTKCFTVPSDFCHQNDTLRNKIMDL